MTGSPKSATCGCFIEDINGVVSVGFCDEHQQTRRAILEAYERRECWEVECNEPEYQNGRCCKHELEQLTKIVLNAAGERVRYRTAFGAIIARVNGDFDNPALRQWPLSDSIYEDVVSLARAALIDILTQASKEERPTE